MVLKRFAYIVNVYTTLLSYAIKRSSFTRSDISGLVFMFVAPLLYGLRVKKIKSPIGVLIMPDREAFRSFVYGFFKTYFYYGKDLTALIGHLHFAVLMDVGANIGDFTLGMSNLAEKIVAIEPGANNFRALETNIVANSLDNVVCLNMAVTKSEGDVYLQGNTSDMFVAEEKKGERIKGMPLDTIVKINGIENVDVLKVDVQGHELPVLFGAHQLFLKKAVKLLIVEVHLKRGVQVGEVISLMDDYGYQLIHSDNYLFDQPHLYFTA